MKEKIKIVSAGSHTEILENFVNEIEKFINDDIIEIITNANMAYTMLKGIVGPTKIEKNDDGKAKIYPIGIFLEKIELGKEN